MRTKKKILLFIIFIGSFLLLKEPLQGKDSSFFPQDSSACQSFGIQRFQVKKEAPPFALKDLSGNDVILSNFKGKPLLLFFWGSYCDACKEDIVLLRKFFEGKKDQFEILTIVIDGEKEKKVRRVAKNNKIDLPILLDNKEKLARTYGVTMIPTAFFVNREGFMEGMAVGQRDWCGPHALPATKELLDLR